MPWPHAFCWTKIGPEAGLTLEQIIRWKEFQRGLSDGLFVWGVGGIPSREKQDAFSKIVREPRVLFSEQRSRAKESSASLLWTRYIDRTGREFDMPEYAAVTSGGVRTAHFAIVCRSGVPLQVSGGIDFDIGMFRNFLGKPNIAFQQTSPIVEANDGGRPKALYAKGFWADLVAFVQLTGGRELTRGEAGKISDLMHSGKTSVGDYKTLVRELKQANRLRS